MMSGSSTVVEQSTHDPKVESSNQGAAVNSQEKDFFHKMPMALARR